MKKSCYKRPDTCEDQTELYSPAHTVRRRESLIFDYELTGQHHTK